MLEELPTSRKIDGAELDGLVDALRQGRLQPVFVDIDEPTPHPKHLEPVLVDIDTM